MAFFFSHLSFDYYRRTGLKTHLLIVLLAIHCGFKKHSELIKFVTDGRGKLIEKNLRVLLEISMIERERVGYYGLTLKGKSVVLNFISSFKDREKWIKEEMKRGKYCEDVKRECN